ncbi:ABC transporter permease [Alicyclobacillus kakegawensis]|uniref:ABC transporter permease n=1 Tax=Alicyclobacillus kakegawensis TaxID=392012 RepID=UPI000829A3E6|nr:ABC transporter permease [Alicyclobacillus kakegawensis]
MPAQSTFWALVRHDFKHRRRRRTPIPRAWRLAYVAAVALVLLAVATYDGRGGHYRLGPVWWVAFGLPFTSFGLAVNTMVTEWKNGTVGWWLTLPYPRLHLSAAKFVAAVVRSVFIYALTYMAMAFFGLYTALVSGHLDLGYTAGYLLTGLKVMGLSLTVCPFVAAFGVVYGALAESRARPAMPLTWILFSGLWWLIFSQDDRYLQVHSDGVPHVSLSPTLCISIACSWVLAYGLIRLAAYLLDEQLAM